MSSFENTPGMHLQNLILDTNVTATNLQKIECVSTVFRIREWLKRQEKQFFSVRHASLDETNSFAFTLTSVERISFFLNENSSNF